MTINAIGWQPTPLYFEMKAGSSGVVRIALTVVQEDDTPLPTYDGFTAELALYRSALAPPEIDLRPTVTGDAMTQRLIIDLDFETALTKGLSAGVLGGDLVIIDPDGERNYPHNISLTIDRSYSPKVVA